MPFLVITRQRCASTTDSCHGDFDINACVCDGRVVSRRAVATLEEVIDWIASGDSGHLVSAEQLWALDKLITNSGGTTGPLPDGAVIEVEPIAWFKLAIEVGKLREWQISADTTNVDPVKAEIIVAYNAKTGAIHA